MTDYSEWMREDLITRINRLTRELEEIRDLARTGLPPSGWPEDYWKQHKLNRISGMADAALKGGE